MNFGWVWKSIAAGLCGTVAHTLLMLFKAQSGILPGFNPYAGLQHSLSQFTGSEVHPAVPWLLSLLNGAMLLGPLFGSLYRVLPGDSAIAKGAVFGIAGWLAMCAIFFPVIGLGFFAANTGLGIWPAAFTLAMLLTYSIIMAAAYARLRNV